MASRESEEQRPSSRPAEQDPPAAADDRSLHERIDKLDQDVDALLDEIDDVLEENAEEFVRGFVQKGGQ